MTHTPTIPPIQVTELTTTDAAKDRLLKARLNKLCVACLESLDEEKPIRGCHRRCHKATMRAIEQGLTTEAERIAEGKLLTRNKGGRKPSNPVTQELRG